MIIQKELIHLLALEELSGVISADDQAYLSLIILENSEAFEVWQETRAVLDTPDVKEFLSRPRSVKDIFLLPTTPKGPNLWGMFSLSILISFLLIFPR